MDPQGDNHQGTSGITRYCVEHYKQAVFTGVFSFIKGYGELIYASLEFVPKFLGACQWIDEEQGTKVGERRMFFIRHVIDDVAEALEMYRETTQTGQILIPWQEGAPINILPYRPEPGILRGGAIALEGEEADSKNGAAFVYFPRLDAPLYLDDSPFRSSTSRGALASQVSLNGRNRELEDFLRDTAVSQWIEKRLMWPLNENLEYLGSFSCIFPNPYYCHLHMQLVPRSQDGKDSVRVVFDRDCSHQGLRFLLEERISMGIGPVRTIPINGCRVDVELTGCSDEVAYKVLDGEDRIVDCHGFASFIRGFKADFYLVKPRKGKKHLGGSPVPLPDSGFKITGSSDREGELPELQLQHKRAAFRFAREAKEKAKFQYLYYGQREEAERRIWGVVASAREKVTIIDPYFSEASIADFIEDLDDGIEVSVCCSSGALATQNSDEPGKRLLEKVEKLVEKGRRIAIEVAGHKHIHDRFVIVDGREAWLLGSSVATLGKSLSAIIKLENSKEVSDKLLEYVRNIPGKIPLKEWLAKSESDRERFASEA